MHFRTRLTELACLQRWQYRTKTSTKPGRHILTDVLSRHIAVLQSKAVHMRGSSIDSHFVFVSSSCLLPRSHLTKLITAGIDVLRVSSEVCLFWITCCPAGSLHACICFCRHLLPPGQCSESCPCVGCCRARLWSHSQRTTRCGQRTPRSGHKACGR